MTGSRFQLLISTMFDEYCTLEKRMNIHTNAIVINQCDACEQLVYEDGEKSVKWFNSTERGIGASRNCALLYSDSEIILFGDSDCRYGNDIGELITRAFDDRPYADMLLFDFAIDPNSSDRQSIRIRAEKRIRWHSSMKYGAIHFAIRRESLIKSKVAFSLLFGGGARYLCGEDSLFLSDCLKAGLKVYAVPITIGTVSFSESSWFEGYTEKYFYDRGALHQAVAGCLHPFVSVRHAFKLKRVDQTINVFHAFCLMRKGAKAFVQSVER